MHHFIFPNQDTWISSGSSNVTGESFRDQNFGRISGVVAAEGFTVERPPLIKDFKGIIWFKSKILQ